MMCYTEKATPARHRPERQYNACANPVMMCNGYGVLSVAVLVVQ